MSDFFPLTGPSNCREQLKLCYAFFVSSKYYHQELAVCNPNPTRYDTRHVFPADMFLLALTKDCNDTIASFDGLIHVVENNNAPVRCIGSHDPAIDRTFQLVFIPSSGENQSALFLQFIEPLPASVKAKIVKQLMLTYSEMKL